jgi:hypothetical protein
MDQKHLEDLVVLNRPADLEDLQDQMDLVDRQKDL